MYKLNDDLREAIIDYVFDQTGRKLVITYPDYSIVNNRLMFLADRETGMMPHRINLETGTISRNVNNGYPRIPRIKEISESSQKFGWIQQLVNQPSSRILTTFCAELLGKLRLNETVSISFSTIEFTFAKTFFEYDIWLEMSTTYDNHKNVNRRFQKYERLDDVVIQILGSVQIIAGLNVSREEIVSKLKELIKE